MKKVISVFAFLIIHCTSFAQTENSAPAGFQYQAIVRDTGGEILANEDISMRFSILEGSASGTAAYVERQSVTTNAHGLISLSIGDGDEVSGTFDGIDWSSGSFFLKVEVNLGSGFEDFGTSELLSVPYALYGEDADADATNEIQDISLDGSNLTISEGSTIDLSSLSGTTVFDKTSNTISAGDSNDDFVFGSDQLADDNSTNDDDARIFFDKSKAAFRVGQVSDDKWDDANVGNESIAIGSYNTATNSASVAIGYSTTSSGVGSTAMGFSTSATQDYAFTAGNYTTASGVSSAAIGAYTSASGWASMAIGEYTNAVSSTEFVIGSYNTDYTPAGDDTDRAFVIGNGDSETRSDAFTVYKNGNALLDGNLSVNEPTADSHVSTKKYVDDNSSDDQDLSNVLGNGADANAIAITNLADPSNDQDAATKNYVDTSIENIADYDEIGNLDFKVLGYGEATDIDYDHGAGNSATAPESRVGQSFRPTISGDLTRVAFNVAFANTNEHDFVLYSGAGFGGAELARVPFTPSGVSIRLVDITFSSAIPVTAGSSYTVAVEGTDVRLSLTLGNPYSDGTAYYGSSNGGSTWDNTTLTTYMSSRNTPQTAISANEVSVGIGTNTPDASAALDVSSATGGLLLPRMTTTERDAISSPADGLMIYNTTTNKFQGRANGSWVDFH